MIILEIQMILIIVLKVILMDILGENRVEGLKNNAVPFRKKEIIGLKPIIFILTVYPPLSFQAGTAKNVWLYFSLSFSFISSPLFCPLFRFTLIPSSLLSYMSLP